MLEIRVLLMNVFFNCELDAAMNIVTILKESIYELLSYNEKVKTYRLYGVYKIK